MLKKKIMGIVCCLWMTACIPLQAQNTSSWETPSGMKGQEFEKYCDTYFNEKVKSEIPGASLAIVSNGQIVFEKGYGYSDIENQKSSDPAVTVYEYGSVSKLFTWASLMKLHEEGKIDLSADIRTYLPQDFKVPMSYDKPITVLNLMNHQGGFDDYIIHLFTQKGNTVSLKDALLEHKVQQVYEPGFASSYSNYGAALAGYIVENVAGMPEYKYVQEQIMRPSGMEQAVLNPDLSDNTYIQQNKAKVYARSGNTFSEENWSIVPMYPAGGANGTIEELAKFAMALLDEKNHPLFEKPETLEELLSTSYQGAPGVAGIAHGLIEYDGEGKTYWHNGGTDHSSTFFAVVPEKNFGIVLCCNSDNIQVIQDFGFDLLKKRKVILEKPEENLPSTSIVAGNYLDFREAHKGITKLISFPRYLESIKVKAINEKQISINGSILNQVSPYIYQDVDKGNKISFTVENGKVVKYSNMLDFIPVPQAKIITAWVEAIILILLIVSLLVSFIALIIAGIRKKYQKSYLLPTLSIAGWGLFIGNMVLIIAKIIEWNTFAALRPQLLIGRGLGIFIVGCNIAGLYHIWAKRKNNNGPHHTVMKGMLSVFCILSLIGIVILAAWGGISVNA